MCACNVGYIHMKGRMGGRDLDFDKPWFGGMLNSQDSTAGAPS